jgi:cell division transport system permease protein
VIRRRTDLLLSRDPSTRLVPWIIGLMTYLACLMLAGALLLSELMAEWGGELSGAATVQVMPVEGESPELLDARVDKLVRLLEQSDGIVAARAIPMAEISEMLEPWLGSGAGLKGLPVPRLIDVQFDELAQPSIESLRTMLSNADTGALLDDHGVWRDQFAGLLQALGAVAILIVLLAGIATVGIVIFATRSGMAAHQDVIEVLHLIGARDAFISRQFQNLALSQGLRGGIIGLALGAATLWGLGYAAASMDTSMLPQVDLVAWHWVVLAALPAATSLIANWTAKRTVMRSLKKLV